MLSKSQAKAFFLGGTGLFSAAFIALSVDSMRQIPALTHDDQITESVARGKHLWEANNCMGCHTLFGEGAYYAPELTQVVARRGAPWPTLCRCSSALNSSRASGLTLPSCARVRSAFASRSDRNTTFPCVSRTIR